MPAIKICSHPGCRKLTDGTPKCEAHTAIKRPARYVPRKEKDRFLDSAAWRKLSKWKLQATPYCEDCRDNGEIRPANDVDHVIPRAERPDLALNEDNLRSLCDSCHGRKTRKDQIRN